MPAVQFCSTVFEHTVTRKLLFSTEVNAISILKNMDPWNKIFEWFLLTLLQVKMIWKILVKLIDCMMVTHFSEIHC